jgi:hypothetical protein
MASKNPEVARIRALKSAVSRRGSSLNASIDAKNVRLQLDESFERENGYSYDYVIVFKVHEESAELTQDQKDFSMRKILQQLAGGGIETKMFYSVERDLVFCKLRATLARIGKEADRIDYKVEFDPMEIQKIAEAGYEEQGIGRILIQDDKHVSKRGAFDNIFAKVYLLSAMDDRAIFLVLPLKLTRFVFCASSTTQKSDCRLRIGSMATRKSPSGASTGMTRRMLLMSCCVCFTPSVTDVFLFVLLCVCLCAIESSCC